MTNTPIHKDENFLSVAKIHCLLILDLPPTSTLRYFNSCRKSTLMLLQELEILGSTALICELGPPKLYRLCSTVTTLIKYHIIPAKVLIIAKIHTILKLWWILITEHFRLCLHPPKVPAAIYSIHQIPHQLVFSLARICTATLKNACGSCGHLTELAETNLFG